MTFPDLWTHESILGLLLVPLFSRNRFLTRTPVLWITPGVLPRGQPPVRDARPWPLDICTAQPKKPSYKPLVFDKINMQAQQGPECRVLRTVSAQALSLPRTLCRQRGRKQAEARMPSAGFYFVFFCQVSADSNGLSPGGDVSWTAFHGGAGAGSVALCTDSEFHLRDPLSVTWPDQAFSHD